MHIFYLVIVSFLCSLPAFAKTSVESRADVVALDNIVYCSSIEGFDGALISEFAGAAYPQSRIPKVVSGFEKFDSGKTVYIYVGNEAISQNERDCLDVFPKSDQLITEIEDALSKQLGQKPSELLNLPLGNLFSPVYSYSWEQKTDHALVIVFLTLEDHPGNLKNALVYLFGLDSDYCSTHQACDLIGQKNLEGISNGG